MSQSFKVSAIQLTANDQKSSNLKKAIKLMEDALCDEPQLIALPEHFNFIGTQDDQLQQCEALEGETLTTLREFANKNSVWVLGGSFFLQSPDSNRGYNFSPLIDSNGELVSSYKKIHLFDIELSGDRSYRESGSTYPGDEVVTVDSPFGVLGLSVCYDLRFPELYRKQVEDGASILFVPAAFTEKTGRVHWHTLLKARAIENQCYVVAPDQWGQHHSNRRSFGGTVIYDPWGECLAKLDEGEGHITAEINPDRISEVRSQIPCLANRVLK